MSYYFSKKINNISLEQAEEKITEALKKEGFGVLTRIDMKTTFKNKLNVDFRPYIILGACNPPFAFKSLSTEDKIGLMLPCNLIIQEIETSTIEIAAIDPVSSMIAVGNKDLESIAGEVQQKLKNVIENV